ncbi:FAD-dependent oxidoreductase [Conexibacter sp. JD483]|uniref:FAD-dependent oxidoreductase n=1 Tax=unclassified Conexibacter TaxID=2627773 RepID=UPI0027276E34|nr:MULTISPECIES: FAD-dependent oxidoreductase [unclassified Conexibacter]MDO8184715.1 FAD-dependent oxidoreductase [Conexibacter sp. CPCC 205706]MDO8198021.1 FAD-dependent oxidoreductase [Conexibacter sp. CPCC 205762]MDR9372314.1 FAD-dependent oxidoreductase [Conexibacter sp. JD483]
MTKVVIAGGGVAAAETLLALRAAPRGAELEIALVSPGEQLDYRPISVLEPFGGAPRRRFPLARICAEHDATLVADGLAAVDGARRAIVLRSGGELPYDALVIAVGARREPAIEGALTYLARDDEMQWIVRELEQRDVRTIGFVVPPQSGWSLPLYELALLTAHHAAARGIGNIALTLVTCEPEPLAVVGGDATRAVARLLGRADVRVVTGRRVSGWERRTVALDPPDAAGPLVVDRLVTLPRLVGPAIPGLPCDAQGFIEVDDHMRVPGLEGVYAVGDATTLPIKQGGLAAQQADLAAALIARAAGPDASQWVRLRAILLTGARPLYIQALIEDGRPRASGVFQTPPWEPAQKVEARYLSPYLAGWSD